MNAMQGPMSFGRRPLAVQALWQTLRTRGEPGSPTLGQRARVFPGMVRGTMNGSYAGMSRYRLGALALISAYIVSPFDAIPEFVLLVFGMGDDAVAGSYLAGALIVETDRYMKWRNGSEGQPVIESGM